MEKVLFDDFFEAGNHSVLLTYAGDDNYYGIYNYYVDFSVKESPDLDADAEVNDNLVGINATVNKTATGNITFIIYDENDVVVKNVTVEIEFGAGIIQLYFQKEITHTVLNTPVMMYSMIL